MRHIPLIRGLVASLAVMVASGCAGPVHVTDIAPHQSFAPATYAFAPLTPNGADIEVQARQLIAAQLAMRGFRTSPEPDYVIDIAVSAHPSKVGIYTSVAQHDDVPTHPYFFGECDDQAMRLAVIVTERRSGKIVSGERGGQLHCDADEAKSLDRLAEAAITAALR